MAFQTNVRAFSGSPPSGLMSRLSRLQIKQKDLSIAGMYIQYRREKDLSIAGMYIQYRRGRDLSIAGMYMQTRQHLKRTYHTPVHSPGTCNHRSIYQSPACIYNVGGRDLSSAGMYIQYRRGRDLSIAGMYIQYRREREIYQSPACIYKETASNTYRRGSAADSTSGF